MADIPFMDKYFAKIMYAVLSKAVKAVSTDAGKWLEDFEGQVFFLRSTQLDRRLLGETLPGGGTPPWTPETMEREGAGIWGATKEVHRKTLGVLGYVKGQIDLAMAGPIQASVQLVNYRTRYASPVWPPDPGSLIQAIIKDERSLDYFNALRGCGFDDWAVGVMETASRHRLSPAEYWTLYRRGAISPEDFKGKYLSHAGMFKEEAAFVDTLNTRLPTLGDLFTAWRREGVSASEFAKEIARIGYDEKDAGFYGDVLRPDMPLDALTRLWRYGHIDEDTYLNRLQKLGFRSQDLADLVKAAWAYPDLSAYYSLERRGVITRAELRDGLKGFGFDPATVGQMEVLRHDTPDASTAIQWRRRGLIDDGQLDTLFKAAGLSPEHSAHMKELVWLIPGVGDLVTMAVREAFTPAAIEKFQLHEDFPADFSTWATKSGLSDFWAKAYWASHWQLPGVQQVFEIFHRIDRATGKPLIDAATVDEYLKVADISPFWRPLLRAVSYSPLTRVDVRRMYQAEVIGEDEVFNTYRDLGYDELKARQLTDWTKEEYRPTKTDLTRAEILDAYRKVLITREQAAAYLKDIGIRDNDAAFYLVRTDLQIEQDKKEVTLASLNAMYQDDLIGEGVITDRMRADNYAEGEIARLLSLWRAAKEKKVVEKAARKVKPTRAELDAFLKAGVISVDEYGSEMEGLGYSDNYIGWYLAAIYYGTEGAGA